MADKIRVSDFDVFCGMDVDKKNAVAVFVDCNERIKRVVLPNRAGAVLSYARKQFPGKRIAYVYEAGPTGFGLYDGLTAANERCLVATPSMIPRAPGQRVKTNRIDGLKLAINLRGGEIAGIVVPTEEHRDLRHLVQWRDTCVKEVGRIQKRIKSLFLFESMEFPVGKWSQEVIERVKAQSARPAVQFKIKGLLRSLKHTQRERERATKGLFRFCRRNAEVSRDMAYALSVPSIGWLTASHFIARTGGWKALSSTKSTCGFIGLGPSEYSTGDRVKRGEITGIGDRLLRSKLIQCSWLGIRIDETLRSIFMNVYQANPRQYAKQKAIVAVTRHTVCRLHAVLRDQRFFVAKTNDIEQREAVFPGKTRWRPRVMMTSKGVTETRRGRKGSRESALQ